ncbi:MAG: archaemetzincin family Zn-dependent metalloprotease [Conexivisphaerales archaeon]
MKPRSERLITFIHLGDEVLLHDDSPALTAASVYGLKARIIPGSFEVSGNGYDQARRQWNATSLISHLKELKENGGYDLVVGLTDNDIFIPGSNFVFGYAEPKAGSAVVSLKRLKESADSKKFEERVYKELAHEIGHLVGLNHCEKETCIMKFANSLQEVDARLPILCNDCAAKVKL